MLDLAFELQQPWESLLRTYFKYQVITHLHHNLSFTKTGSSTQTWKTAELCSVSQLCPTLWDPWTVSRQAPLSVEFSRQEYWSGLRFPTPGNVMTSLKREIGKTKPGWGVNFFEHYTMCQLSLNILDTGLGWLMYYGFAWEGSELWNCFLLCFDYTFALTWKRIMLLGATHSLSAAAWSCFHL